MSTGGGLAETMAVLSIPITYKSRFIATEKRIGKWWGTILEESMKLAGQEKRELAIARGLVDPVILDGCWSKLAHNISMMPSLV